MPIVGLLAKTGEAKSVLAVADTETARVGLHKVTPGSRSQQPHRKRNLPSERLGNSYSTQSVFLIERATSSRVKKIALSALCSSAFFNHNFDHNS